MKKTVIEADQKSFGTVSLKKAEEEITKLPQSVERVTLKANRTDRIMKEETGNVFLTTPTRTVFRQAK